MIVARTQQPQKKKKNVESPEKPRMSPETKRITQTPILVTPSHFGKKYVSFFSLLFPPLPITLRPIECPLSSPIKPSSPQTTPN